MHSATLPQSTPANDAAPVLDRRPPSFLSAGSISAASPCVRTSPFGASGQQRSGGGLVRVVSYKRHQGLPLAGMPDMVGAAAPDGIGRRNSVAVLTSLWSSQQAARHAAAANAAAASQHGGFGLVAGGADVKAYSEAFDTVSHGSSMDVDDLMTQEEVGLGSRV
jgi:hypothetical protein